MNFRISTNIISTLMSDNTIYGNLLVSENFPSFRGNMNLSADLFNKIITKAPIDLNNIIAAKNYSDTESGSEEDNVNSKIPLDINSLFISQDKLEFISIQYADKKTWILEDKNANKWLAGVKKNIFMASTHPLYIDITKNKYTKTFILNITFKYINGSIIVLKDGNLLIFVQLIDCSILVNAGKKIILPKWRYNNISNY